MAKTFLATGYEMTCIMDGDISADTVEQDWYRQRFIARVNGLLGEAVDIEIPFQLPRDQYESSIIPGGVTFIEGSTLVQSIGESIGIDSDDDCQFSVMTGKHYRARDNDHPARLVLAEPKRSRDVVLMASWPNGVSTQLPDHPAMTEICESPVVQSTFFSDGEYNTGTWVVRNNSPLGKLLIAESQQKYFERLQAGIEHFKNYEQTYIEVRDELWERLSLAPHDATGADPLLLHITCYDRYVHATWYEDNIACDDYYFYTKIGFKSVIDLVNSRVKKEFTLIRAF